MSFALLIALSFHAAAQQNMCSHSFAKELQSYMKHVKMPGFAFACPENKTKMDPHYAVTPDKLNQFYSELAKQVRTDLNNTKDYNSRMNACLKNTAGCTEEQTKDLARFRSASEVARKLAAYVHASDGDISDSSLTPFSGAFKMVPWAPLNKNEVINAQRQFETYRDSLGKKFDDLAATSPSQETEPCNLEPDFVPVEGQEGAFRQVIKPTCVPSATKAPQSFDAFKQRYVQLTLNQERTRAEDLYRQYMGNFIILQFVRHAPASDKELLDASDTVKSRLEGEDSKLANLEKKLTNKEDLSKDDLYVLGYQAELEKVLILHPEYCQLAAGLLQMQKMEKAQVDATMNLVIAASLILPTPLAVVATGVTSVAMIGRANHEYEQAIQGRLVSWEGKDSFVPQTRVDEAYGDLTGEVVGDAANVGGIGLFKGKTVAVVKKALKAVAKEAVPGVADAPAVSDAVALRQQIIGEAN